MTVDTLPDLQQREQALNDALARDRLVSAYATFYGPELWNTPDGGRTDVVRFLEWADRFIGRVPLRNAVTDHASYSEWASAGRDRATARDVWVIARSWRSGKVVRERAMVRRRVGSRA
jgi:hypothetical protein